tara:strand:- start:114 stop:344 length:231 start_codon:yes stop_codon:yes gene_type:complete
MAKNKKAIIQILATKYNLPLQKVEEIVEYQFKYVSKIMEQGNFDPIRLPYFGKFSAKKGRIKHIQNKVNGTINDKG